MPAGEPDRTSRRTALTGLAAMLATGCGRLEFMAANVPAAFGAYQRHPDISYGAELADIEAFVKEPRPI